MTKEQAVKWVKFVHDVLYEDKDEEIREALRMAIEALSAEAVPHGRLIDADRLKSYIDCGHLRPPTEVCFSELDVCNMIDKAPTASAEAVEVVRCGECEYWKCNPNTEEYGVCKKVSYDDFEVVMNGDDFCSYGRRREDGEA